jgi:putative transposase
MSRKKTAQRQIRHSSGYCHVIRRRKINLSAVFAGQTVGIREISDRVWLVSFMDFDLGFFDQDEDRVEPAPNPFLPKVIPMSPV